METPTNPVPDNLDGIKSLPVPENKFPVRLKLLRWTGKQAWIPGGHDWLLRRIWHPDAGRHFPFEVDFFGMRYAGDLVRFVDWKVFAYGSHASNELTLLEALAAEIRNKRGHVFFFDVGANVGHHTLFMANKSDAVFAFEPFAPLQNLIRQRIELNQLDNIRVIPFALGDGDAIQSYYPGDVVNPGTGTFLPDAGEINRVPVSLEIRKGDALCDELNLPPIDILKVDVEGFEPKVFRGLNERIRRDRPAVLTEFTAESRAGYASEDAFRKSWWEGAVFAEVCGRNGHPFKLKPFVYDKSYEALIVPPELAYFVKDRLA